MERKTLKLSDLKKRKKIKVIPTKKVNTYAQNKVETKTNNTKEKTENYKKETKKQPKITDNTTQPKKELVPQKLSPQEEKINNESQQLHQHLKTEHTTWKKFLPLSLNTRTLIHQKYENRFSPEAIQTTIKIHVKSLRYLKKLSKSKERYNLLTGEIEGKVRISESKYAKVQLKNIQNRIKKRKKKAKQQLLKKAIQPS